MKTIFTMALAMILATGVAFTQQKGGAPGGAAKGKGGPGLTLTTTAFQDGGIIPDKYTQQVGDAAVSPQLFWSNVPAGTQSFVLHMLDPDVAIGRNNTSVIHWIAWNIPATATGLPEGVKPVAQSPDGMIQGMNQGNAVGYRGPGAPAAGPPHHYTFELFALDTKLDLPPTATRDQVLAAVNGHVNGKAVLVGRFIRH